MPQHSSDIACPPQPPLVAVGGSAGSLDALIQFFELLPEECGMAFLVAIHLAPSDENLLPAVLQRHCALTVLSAGHEQRFAANHVYVITPGRELTRSGSQLRLQELDLRSGCGTVIDVLFASVAEPRHGAIAGVLLSGAGFDGAAGLHKIQQAGGLTLVQTPTDASQPSMPRTAIAGGSADAVLSAADMPARLLSHFGIHAVLRAAPQLQSTQSTQPTAVESDFVRRAMLSLRRRTGRDFSGFRENALLYQLHRRMKLSGSAKPEDYLQLINYGLAEPEALIRELLVSVTSFFRDPEAFNALARHLPQLFKNKSPADCVRVWVPACATGEEVYSIAILLLEHARTLAHPPGIQIIGSDLDLAAIEKARAGVYRPKIATPVGPELLARYFQEEAGAYRVRRELRQVVLFAEHDALRDPALTSIDLVSCRNLLIYLSREGQARLLDVFHLALDPHGLLFLGVAESLPLFSTVFVALDSKHHLYQREGKTHQRLSGANTSQELQAVTQELQATSEELEINRQELRLINTRLSVVNKELSSKLTELAQTNSDLDNVMSAVAMPMVFLDPELKIMRYTPKALELFRLIPADIGRALSDLRNRLDYPELMADAQQILSGRAPIEREIRDESGKWFLARVLPYYALQQQLAGVVLAFFDMTERKQLEAALQESEQKVRTFISATSGVICER